MNVKEKYPYDKEDKITHSTKIDAMNIQYNSEKQRLESYILVRWEENGYIILYRPFIISIKRIRKTRFNKNKQKYCMDFYNDIAENIIDTIKDL